MEADSKPVTAKSIDEYFKNYAATFNDKQKVKVTAAVMELLRMTGGFAETAGDCYPTTATAGLVELLAQLCELPWQKVAFSLTVAAFKHPGAPIDVFEGLKSFATVVETEPASATREVFDALMEPPPPVSPPPPPPAQPAKKGPELATAGELARVFSPAKFQAEGNPAAELVSWQSMLSTGGPGPQYAAVTLENYAEPKLLLQTGEFKRVSNHDFQLAQTTDPADYVNVPPYLLACLRVYAPYNWVVDPPVPEAQLDARFGKFTKPLHVCPYSMALAAPLMQVFDMPHACPPGNVVSVTLSVDGTPYFVTLDARVSKTGPYVTAKLLDSNDNIVMRLDTPRMFSPLGVYLFPLKELAIALILH